MGYREYRLHQDSLEIPQVDRSDIGSISARIDALQGFKNKHKLWLGLNRVEREVADLEQERAGILGKVAEQVAAEKQALADQLQRAEDWRAEGLRAADRGAWSEARANFKKALEEAPDGWKHTQALRKDIEAIDSIGSPEAAQGSPKGDAR